MLLAGNVIVVESVPAKVRLFETVRVLASVPAKVRLALAVRVFPSAIVRVDPLAGAVRATLFMVVAVATPRVGVVSAGLMARTLDPVPVTALLPVY